MTELLKKGRKTSDKPIYGEQMSDKLDYPGRGKIKADACVVNEYTGLSMGEILGTMMRRCGRY